MAEFKISGPHNIPYSLIGKDWRKRVETDKLKDFWKGTARKEAFMRGVYVFAMKAAKGYMPYYVGKAGKQSFEKECFAPHKLAYHYCGVLTSRQGKPVMFFVSQGKGPWNEKQIGEIEKYLIVQAHIKNPNLTNKTGKDKRQWSIKGVIGGGKGKASKEAQAFKKAIGF